MIVNLAQIYQIKINVLRTLYTLFFQWKYCGFIPATTTLK